MTVSISNMSQVWMSNTNTYNAIAMSVSTMSYGANSNSRLLLFKVDGNTKFDLDTDGNIISKNLLADIITANTLIINNPSTSISLNVISSNVITANMITSTNITSTNITSGNITVSKVITPSVGSSPDTGIRWPINPGGGAGDAAFLNYYVAAGETTRFVIGTDNDADDTLSLYQFGADRLTIYNGNVGIGNTLPSYKLQVQGIGYFSENLIVSGNNATGGGIILSDDGDIVDLNDGYCSMRFSTGLRVYSGNKSGTPAITLGSNGNLSVANATISTNTLNLGTSSIGSSGYTRLPNGLLLQWGTSGTILQDSSGSVTFPVAFAATPYCIQITARGGLNTTSGGLDSISTANTSQFTIAHGADGPVTFYWMAIGI